MNPKTTLTNDQIISIFQAHHLGDSPKITRITIGFTNEVYQVDTYILKVCVKKDNEVNFRKEEFLYELLQDSVPVPRVLVADDSRILLDQPYMIYEKLSGEPAASHWHEMSMEQRRQFINKLCGYLKIIDQTPIERYGSQLRIDPSFNWQQHIVDRIQEKVSLITKQKLLPETRIEEINRFVTRTQHVLEPQKFGLTFWDVHHDNFLLNEDFELVGLLDFESVDVYSIDYRLMVVRLMQRYPNLYLSEKMEPYARSEDYALLMKWYEAYYPELFAFEEIDTRIDLYELLDIVSKLPDWPTAHVLRERLATLLGSS